ncbi:MAG TPA: LytTR family DNA-binding domain-containing protein [Thermoanaerobaculia bacterium]|nr:LytTR family DNA-binding domain-containing protein [Thermoanaerobaculia bacterium]
MRILVVEDEAVVARRLLRLVAAVLGDQLAEAHHAPTLHDALDAVSRRPYDLLFLDLDLDGRDGFGLLTEAVAGSFQTIVVSAHEEQAIRAFEHGVADFVPKPFDEARLRLAVARATAREAGPRELLRFLGVRRQGEVYLIPLERVVSIAGAGDYSEVRCDDGSRHLHDKTLAALEVLLPSRFERVHRSHLVDLGRAVGLRSEPGSRYWLRLATGGEVPVSRGRVADLRRRVV